MKNPLTQERLKSLLHYDLLTGQFTYTVKTCGKKPGDIAGFNASHGYRQICVDGVVYYAHRLAFLFMTGSFPAQIVDHINNNPQDNRWTNLREATRAENNRNSRLRKDNTTGYRGVIYSKGVGKYNAYISVDKKRHNLGTYDTAEEAGAVAQAARLKHFGAFAPKQPQQ